MLNFSPEHVVVRRDGSNKDYFIVISTKQTLGKDNLQIEVARAILTLENPQKIVDVERTKRTFPGEKFVFVGVLKELMNNENAYPTLIAALRRIVDTQ